MKKLESLKDSKFKHFESDVIDGLFSFTGGKCMNTYASASASLPNDKLSDERTTAKLWTNIDGSDPWRADKEDTICTVPPSEGMGGRMIYISDYGNEFFVEFIHD